MWATSTDCGQLFLIHWLWIINIWEIEINKNHNDKSQLTIPLDVQRLAFLNKISEMVNAEVLFREDATADDLIDVIQGNRIYMPCLYVS